MKPLKYAVQKNPYKIIQKTEKAKLHNKDRKKEHQTQQEIIYTFYYLYSFICVKIYKQNVLLNNREHKKTTKILQQNNTAIVNKKLNKKKISNRKHIYYDNKLQNTVLVLQYNKYPAL